MGALTLALGAGHSASAAAPPGPPLPVAALQIDVGHPNPVARHSWTLVVRVHNTGSATLAPQGLLVLTSKGASAPLQQQLLIYPHVAPGHTFDGRVNLGGLALGSYELDVKLGAAGAFLDHVHVAFATRAHEGFGKRIVGYLPFLLAIVAGVAAFVFARRALPSRRPPGRPSVPSAPFDHRRGDGS